MTRRHSKQPTWESRWERAERMSRARRPISCCWMTISLRLWQASRKAVRYSPTFKNSRLTCWPATSPKSVPFLLFVALPVPLALTVIQILSIDLGTDLLPAIGLGQEPPERDIMSCPPRGLQQRLLSGSLMTTAYLFLGMIQAAYSLAMFFLVLNQGGWQWGQSLAEDDPLYRAATGITLSTIVLMQIGNLSRPPFASPFWTRSTSAPQPDHAVGHRHWRSCSRGPSSISPPLQRFLGTGPGQAATVCSGLVGDSVHLSVGPRSEENPRWMDRGRRTKINAEFAERQSLR